MLLVNRDQGSSVLCSFYSAQERCISKFNAGRVFYPVQLSDAVSASSRESHRFERSKIAMLDIGMIAIGVGFFVASILYVLACERM